MYKKGIYIFFASMLGFIAGGIFVYSFIPQNSPIFPQATESFSYESQIMRAVDKVSPSVVSIVVTKDIPVLERYYYDPFAELREFFGDDFGYLVEGYRQKGTEEKEVGGGTGFIVSSDGLILTNKHVVKDTNANYSVLTNNGTSIEARVLARDPVQDIAILKVEAQNLPVVELGNSDNLRIGQTVIAIGNVLGEFRNSASMGIVAGLKRNINASGEELRDIIQTDAAINQGNSGGPLLDSEGRVIGINTAMAIGAENVGFAIPINRAKRDIEQVRDTGEISYPFLGIYYKVIEEGVGVTGVFDDSPAQEAGLQKGDVVTKFGGQRLNISNTLADVLWRYVPGDEVSLEATRGDDEMELTVTLETLE